MNLRSRSEQLADHLRGCLVRGELTEPLPGTRSWADKLGVSPTTLKLVLKQLQREGLVVIEPRKPIRLGKARPSHESHAPGLVRILYYGAEYPDRSLLPWFPRLAEKLFEHGIHAVLESCTLPRLRSIASQTPSARELLVLASIPGEYQALFDQVRQRALIIGQPSPQTPISFINVDVDGCVVQGTTDLLKRGVTQLSFLLGTGRAQGIQRAIDTFHETCCDWERSTSGTAASTMLRTEVVQSDMNFESEARTIQRLVARVHAPQGILVLDPVPVPMLMTALLDRPNPVRGIEIRGLLTWPWPVPVCHPPPCYPYPMEATIKHKVRTILRYFETGTMPEVRTTVPVSFASTPW